MTSESITAIAEELKNHYDGATSATEGDVTFVRVPAVHFPAGCQPKSTAALVLLDRQQATPKLLLKELPKLKNGAIPRSTSSETAAGEGWFGFSFNQPWSEASNSGLQFVEGRLRRFALNE